MKTNNKTKKTFKLVMPVHNYTEDMFREMDRREKLEKAWQKRVLAMLKRDKIGTSEDFIFLEGIVAAS